MFVARVLQDTGEVAHGLMRLVGHPDRNRFAGRVTTWRGSPHRAGSYSHCRRVSWGKRGSRHQALVARLVISR